MQEESGRLKLRYYDVRAEKERKALSEAPKGGISAFFYREEPDPNQQPFSRTYCSKETVAYKTETTLNTKARSYFQQLKAFDTALQFTPLHLTRVISSTPHLGYAAITSGSYHDPKTGDVHWVFFFANFNCRFGKGDALFEDIPLNYGLTYFALALTLDDNRHVEGLDACFRGNGLMFATPDPDTAFANVVALKDLQQKLPIHEARGIL